MAWHSMAFVHASSLGVALLIHVLTLQELPCGHFMHSHCFAQYTRYNYTCPVCSKTMGDMSMYFRMIDSLVARSDDLPAGYACRKQVRPGLSVHLCIWLLAHAFTWLLVRYM